jgi:hypothetical protein
MSRRTRWSLALLLLITAVPLALLLSRRPSNDRDWRPNDAVLAHAEFDGPLVHIGDIRYTTYKTESTYTPAYYDRTFDLRRLRRVWFVVEPFSDWQGAAHTFLSFEFAGPDGPAFVGISVEARKERGESYSFVKGLLRGYELMYLVADERDLVRLRTNVRRDDVFLYPVRARPERARELFIAMLERANRLRERPEWYNTLTSNCTNNIIRHVNELAPGQLPFSFKSLFPGYADEIAYDLGLIDTDLPFAEIRDRFRINDRALEHADAPDFSVRIREGLPGARPPRPGSAGGGPA